MTKICKRDGCSARRAGFNQWLLKYTAQYFVNSVNADSTYGIKGNYKRLQVFTVLYICFYIFGEISCFGPAAKRAYFDTKFFVSGNLDLDHSVYDITRFLNASFCRTLVPIRASGTIGMHMLLDFIRIGKNREMGSLLGSFFEAVG